MIPYTIARGTAAPLMRQNVDTDVIIRIERLITLPKTELGPYCFESWRYHPDGTPDPAFILNQPPYSQASILLAGANFGCGSSREAAVWALEGLGIRTVIAPSFGEIFYGNCFQNGVLPILLPQETVESLANEARTNPAGTFTVDLIQQRITPPSGTTVAFACDPAGREMLLEGLDGIAMTLKHQEAMDAYQFRDRAERPWIYSIENARDQREA